MASSAQSAEKMPTSGDAWPREEALRMASLYPAQFLGMADRRGRLAQGYQADLTLLDPCNHVLGTWVAGGWRKA